MEEEFRQQLDQRGVRFLLLPPVYQANSFDNQSPLIDRLQEVLESEQQEFFVPPDRYRFDDELFFNTSYHLTKQGVDLRSKMVAEDLESYYLEK